MPAAILHLLGTAEPEGTSIARVVGALATGLDPAKYRVHAWFLGPTGPLVEDLQAAGASALSINWQHGLRDPVGAWRFWHNLRNHDFAIVHQHFGARSIRRLVSLSARTRLVVHLHGLISDADARRDAPIATQGADVVIAASRAIANQIPGLNPVVIHAGLELSNVLRGDDHGRPELVIGAACRLVPLKGLSDLILAVGLLKPEFPQLRLEIAGTGPARDLLEAEVNRLGLKQEVRFLGWCRDLGPVFRTWDIFAMPSLDEGFGMAAVEAMAEGLPVVATTVGGLPEIVEDAKTGYLIPPSDVGLLADRLRSLAGDPVRRRSMGVAGRERVRAHFTAKRMVGEIAAIYDSLIDRVPSRPRS